MTSPTSNRQILESMFEARAFKSPEFEYELRSDDFVAEIPQTGERFESRDALKAMQESSANHPTSNSKKSEAKAISG